MILKSIYAKIKLVRKDYFIIINQIAWYFTTVPINQEILMYKKLVSTLYAINIVSQAILTLLIPIGLGALVSYLLTTYAGVMPWIWAVLIPLGAISGIISMIKFVLSAMSALNALEKQHKETNNINTGKTDEQQ